MNTLGVPMIDGIKMGIEISPKQHGYCAAIFEQYAGEPTARLEVKGLTTATLLLNRHNGKNWLNLHCNPISFVTGQNVIGHTDESSIRNMWYAVDGLLQEGPKVRGPLLDRDMRDRIKKNLIAIHQIAFASYTKVIPKKYQPQLLRFVDTLYAYPLSAKEDKSCIKDRLGVLLEKGGEYSLTFSKRRDTHRVWRLCMYNKEVELKETGANVTNLNVEEYANKLRLDLTLSSTWIRDNTRHHEHKGTLAALMPLREVAETQLSRVLAETHFATIASPLSVHANEPWFKTWGHNEASNKACRAAGYHPELGLDFYRAVDFVKRNYADGYLEKIDPTAWQLCVERFVARVTPTVQELGVYDADTGSIEATPSN